MNSSELIFIGIRGSVVALNRATGSQVWATPLKGYDLVNVLVENGRIFASSYGEIFCLDPNTGDALWHNPLKGFGRGLTTIASEQMTADQGPMLMAEKRRRDEQAAASVSVTAA